jgi:hypothetical protein
MNQINKGIAIFVSLLSIAIILGFIKAPVNMQTSVREHVSMQTPDPETQITGFFIEFENGTTESEVKAILENYNKILNYTIDYNSDIMPKRYYLIVDKDKIMNVKYELRMEENWTKPAPNSPEFQKGNYYIVTIPEQIIHDKNFHAILEKNNLQVNESVLCYIHFGDGFNNGILVQDASRIEKDLEMNEKILIATPEGKVAGYFIQFENGTTEPEVKTILENYNMTLNYTIDYNFVSIDPKHYIMVA